MNPKVLSRKKKSLPDPQPHSDAPLWHEMAALPLNFLKHVQVTITATQNSATQGPRVHFIYFHCNVYKAVKFALITVAKQKKNMEIDLKTSNRLYISRLKFNKSHFQHNFRGKKIKSPALVKNMSFSLESQLGMYIKLYSFESSIKWPYRVILIIMVKKIIWLQSHAEPTLCKEISSKNWLRSRISL